MALITTETAAKHLRQSATDPAFLRDLEGKLEHATALVIKYIKRPNHGWTDQTDPATDAEFAIVQAAILKVLSNLYAFRGDEEFDVNPISAGVVEVLSMVRDPTVS